SVDNLLTHRPISEEDVPPLIAFSSQAALAISRAQLWADHAAQSRYLARRVTELEWLREMSRRVNIASTLDEVLDVVSVGVHDGLGYERVAIWLFDESCTRLEPRRVIDSDHLPTGNIQSIATGAIDTLPAIPGLARLTRGEVAC